MLMALLDDTTQYYIFYNNHVVKKLGIIIAY